MTDFLRLASTRTVLVSCLGGLLATAGCTEKETEAARPAAVYSGQVKLYDEFGAPLNDAGGVLVSLYDDTSVSTQTAADGSFVLRGGAAGTHRVVFSKNTFGQYYSAELDGSGAGYTFGRPVRLGQRSTVHYTVACAPNDSKRYLIVMGTMVGGTAGNPRRTHRLFLEPGIGNDGYANLTVFKLTRKRLNNAAAGFSDTIPYSVLAAAGLQSGSFISVHGDNPAADSCQYPFSGGTFSMGYPATGVAASNPQAFVWHN